MRTFLLTAVSFLALGSAASADTIAITGGKVWTGTDRGTIENGTVIITDGEITAVGGATTDIPSNATLIDAKGGWVTPGIISPFSRTGIVEVSGEDSTDDRNAGGSEYSVALDASLGFNPKATPIDVTRIEGLTRIVVAPGRSSNLFAGQGFVADTSGNIDSITKPRAFVMASLGTGGATSAGGSRPAAWQQFRSALSDARTFPARFLAHNEGDALHRVDAQAFGPASRGQQLILIEAHRASDLMEVIRFGADNPALNFAIVGADEGWLVADQLAASGIPVIIDPFQNLPASFEQLGATSQNAQRLISAGVLTAFSHLGDDTHQARLILQTAGNAVANGTDHDDAMTAITRAPALIFGLEGHGLIQRGAVSDVVVWDGDPLEITSSPTTIVIDGALQSLESRQTRLRDRYLTLDESERPLAYRRP